MASTLRVFPTPAALRVPGGVGRGFRCAGVPVRRRNCDGFGFGFRSVRCVSEDSAGESVVREEKKDVALHPESSSSSLHSDGHDVSALDKFRGWYADEVETEKYGWQIAAMQVAAGFLLALGLSLSYYVWCRKQGRSVIPTPPALTQIQLPSFLKRSSPEPEVSDQEEVDEFGSKNTEGDRVKNNFGKEVKAGLRSDKGKVVESKDVEDDHNREDQRVLEGDRQFSSDESDNQDQEKASDGIKDEPLYGFSYLSAESTSPILDIKNAIGDSEDEPRLSTSESTVEPASIQWDRKHASDGSKDEPRFSASELAPEPENSRQDTKKTQKGGNDEPQFVASQSRKPRRSQRNKKKTSAVQGRRGRVVVPAVVDRMQEQALAVLQALKVVEEGSDPQAICKRRDYARWIVASSSTLTRSPANKVFPAMCLEDDTVLAFADVTPDDPDFPFIQGLAEAGLITSNLYTFNNGDLGEGVHESDPEEISFFPDSPVSRQELVSWKAALGRRSLSSIDKEGLHAKSGFLDIDRIESRLWPLLGDDLDSGENSIITSAFGFTRRFQPDKPVTIGQAAIALSCGDTSERFAEELARLQAERMADEAVAADEASEAQQQKELNALFDGQLSAERQQKERAQKLFEVLKAEFEMVKTERAAEKDGLLKDKTSVESEKQLLLQMKEELDWRLQELSMREMQISTEQEKLEKLRIQSEDHEEELSRLLYEAGVEKQALVQARLWAEDEARKARAHAEALEQTRNRRASRGYEPSAAEDNISGRSWHRPGMKARTELEMFLQRAPMQDVMDKGEDLKANANNALIQSWQTILRVLNGFLQRVGDLLQEIRWKTQHYYHVTSWSTGNLLQGSASAVSQKFQGLQAAASDFSASVGDRTKTIANECKGEVQKLARRFKNA